MMGRNESKHLVQILLAQQGKISAPFSANSKYSKKKESSVQYHLFWPVARLSRQLPVCTNPTEAFALPAWQPASSSMTTVML